MRNPLTVLGEVLRFLIFVEYPPRGIDENSPLGKAVSNPFAGSNLKDGVNQLLEQWGIPVRL